MSLAGVPDELEGCHLVQIDGYVVEDPVQVSAIRRLLAERPANVAAITLPGMPGTKPGPLKIYAISKVGGAPTLYDVQ